MKKSIPFIMMIAILCLGACGTTAPERLGEPTFQCDCGSPEADLDGCLCAACVSGEGNPENPLCTCDDLHAGDGEGGN